MTKEEAIDIIKCLAWHTRPNEEDIEQAIKALEQEHCDHAISCDIAVANVQELAKLHPNDANNLNRVIKCLETLPPVQPKIGHWILKEKGLKITSYYCSECGRYVRDDTGYDVSKDYPFCHCGAKMIEPQESEDKE